MSHILFVVIAVSMIEEMHNTQKRRYTYIYIYTYIHITAHTFSYIYIHMIPDILPDIPHQVFYEAVLWNHLLQKNIEELGQ